MFTIFRSYPNSSNSKRTMIFGEDHWILKLEISTQYDILQAIVLGISKELQNFSQSQVQDTLF